MWTIFVIGHFVLGLLVVRGKSLQTLPCDPAPIIVQARLLSLSPSGFAQIRLLSKPSKGNISEKNIFYDAEGKSEVVSVYGVEIKKDSETVGTWFLDQRSHDGGIVFCKFRSQSGWRNTLYRTTWSEGNGRSKSACGRRKCSFHSKCVMVNGHARCLCQSLCPARFRPVCGSDNRTYANRCILKRTSCQKRRPIHQKHPGKCDLCKRNPCPHNGVCSVNIRTGKRECQCPLPTKDCPGRDGKQICGSDNVTYHDECHMRMTACSQKKTIRIQKRGPCPVANICEKVKCSYFAICLVSQNGHPECVCPNSCDENSRAVCGSNGQTYTSVCNMKMQACFLRKNITVVAEEPCHTCRLGCPLGTTCVHGKCQCRENCPGLAMPVCGSDGHVYRNECELKRQACVLQTSIGIDPSGKLCPSNDAPVIDRADEKGVEYEQNDEAQNVGKPSSIDLGISLTSRSSSTFKPSQSFRWYHTLDLRVIPKYLNGSILFLGRLNSNSDSDTMRLKIEDGHVIYSFNLGSGPLNLKSDFPLKIGRLYHITTTRKGRWGKLTVDANSWTGRSPGHLKGFRFKADHRLVIGKVKDKKVSSFAGCLLAFSLSAHRPKKQINLIKDMMNPSSETRNIEHGCSLHVCHSNPCLHGGTCSTKLNDNFQCNCSRNWEGRKCEKKKDLRRFRVPAFHGNAYISIPSKVHLLKRKKFELEFWFLSSSMNGLVAQLGNSSHEKSHFLRLELLNGWLRVECRSGYGLVRMTSDSKLPIGEWILLRLRKTRTSIAVKLNEDIQFRMRIVARYFKRYKKSEKRKMTKFLAYKMPLYVGGIPRNSTKEGQDVWLKGAVQRVIVNKRRIDLYSPLLLRSPELKTWDGAPCSSHRVQCGVGRECEPRLGSAHCVCTNPPCMDKPQHDQPQNLNVGAPITQQNDKAINLNGYSLLKLKNAGDKRRRRFRKNSIVIRLKTISRQGMILLSTQTQKRSAQANFYLLALRNGHPELAFNVGGRNGLIRIRGATKINDNKWHTIEAYRKNNLVTLTVDHQSITGKINSSKAMIHVDGWLWIGGVQAPIRGFPWEYNQGFMGCIQEVMVDSKVVDLRQNAAVQRGEIETCKLPFEF